MGSQGYDRPQTVTVDGGRGLFPYRPSRLHSVLGLPDQVRGRREGLRVGGFESETVAPSIGLTRECK